MEAPDAPAGVVLAADQLSPEALRSLVEEFVTRDGTDYGAIEAGVEAKIAQVTAQLASGEAHIVFDPETETANIVLARGGALGDDEREALQALGYDAAWLEAGILERGLLAEQHARLLSGGTRKTARYRSQAVTAWCAADGEIPDAQLEAFLALIGDEPDAKLAHKALAEVIRSPRLSLEGLERIARADPKLVQRHVPLLRRTVLSRRLDERVTDALIEQVIELQDAAIQTQLVRDSRLSRQHAEALAKRGANPTIRENAVAWFQDKKAWR